MAQHNTSKVFSQANPAMKAATYGSSSIVVLHPFYSNSRHTKDFRDDLRKSLDTLAGNEVVGGISNIYVFSFKYKDVINSRTTIKAVSDKLVAKLAKHRKIPLAEFEEAVQSFSDDPVTGQSSYMTKTQEVGDDTKATDASKQPYLLFISHSLASWVVKSALSENKQPNLSLLLKTQLVILLDSPTVFPRLSSIQYMNSLFKDVLNRREPKLKGTVDPGDGFIQTLKNVDKAYKAWINSHYVQEARQKEHLIPIVPADHLSPCSSENNFSVVDREIQDKGSKSIRKYSILRISNRKSKTNEHKNRVPALVNFELHDHVLDYFKQKDARGTEPTSSAADSVLFDSNAPENHQSRLSFMAQYQATALSSPEWFTKRRTSTISNTLTISSDSDDVSVGSAPSMPPFISGHIINDPNLRRNIDMGKTFVKKGELGNAETAFQRALEILTNTNPLGRDGYKAEIDVQLASIALFRGRYGEAHEEFEALLLRPVYQGEVRDTVAAVIRRWKGISLLYQGKHGLAAKQFRLLLTKFSANCKDEEVQIRRDLALASAHLGNFDEAFHELQEAHKCLEPFKGSKSADYYSFAEGRNTRKDEMSARPAKITPIPSCPNAHETEATSIAENYQRPRMGSELKAKKDALYFAQAKIGLIWGSFDSALKDSERALRGMKKRLGPKHFKTLECASLNALLLALNSHREAAESACDSTYRTMSIELGSDHPFTLEAMGRLVQIYQMQSRFLEAVDTARSLDKLIKSHDNKRHAQILQARYIRAECELKIGNFATAADELIDIVDGSQIECNECRPETLRYQTLLALAHHHCADDDKAERMALDVLRGQLELYVRRQNDTSDQDTANEKGLAHQVALIEKLASIESLHRLITTLVASGLVSKIRPPLLKTLLVISLILQQKDDMDSFKLATQILQTVWGRLTKEGKSDDHHTLQIRYELALAIRREAEAETEASPGKNHARLEDSAKHLREIQRIRSRVLGSEHPDTLSAKLELIITNCTLDRWEDVESLEPPSNQSSSKGNNQPCARPLDQRTWNMVQSESCTIAYFHEAQLGENHPETLKSFTWLLTVQMFLGDTISATETLDKTLQRLKTVQRQRLIDSLNQQYKLALVIADVNKQRAKDILTEVWNSIQDNRHKIPMKWSTLGDLVSNDIRHLDAASG